MAAILPTGMRAVSTEISPETGAGGFILPNDRVDVLLSKRERIRTARGRTSSLGNHPDQHPRAGDRPGAEGKRTAERRGRQDRNARAEARPGRDAGARAPDRHAVAGAAQHRRCHEVEKIDEQHRAAAKASTSFVTASPASRRCRSDRKDARDEVQGKSANDADIHGPRPVVFGRDCAHAQSGADAGGGERLSRRAHPSPPTDR